MPSRLIIVAHTHDVGKYYAKQFNEPSARVTTTVQGLYGVGPDSEIIIINSDEGGHFFSKYIIERLKHLEASGVKINWLG